MKGTTKSGFAFEIDDEIDDDYEFFDLLCAVDNGDYSKTTAAIRYLLGDEQEAKLKEHIRNEKGKVRASAMLQEFKEIIEINIELKNSQPSP